MQAKPSQATLDRLDAERNRLGITLEAVAEAASKTSKRGSVGITTVSKVLSGRTKSANVVATVRRLIAEARQKAVSAA